MRFQYKESTILPTTCEARGSNVSGGGCNTEFVNRRGIACPICCTPPSSFIVSASLVFTGGWPIEEDSVEPVGSTRKGWVSLDCLNNNDVGRYKNEESWNVRLQFQSTYTMEQNNTHCSQNQRALFDFGMDKSVLLAKLCLSFKFHTQPNPFSTKSTTLFSVKWHKKHMILSYFCLTC